MASFSFGFGFGNSEADADTSPLSPAVPLPEACEDECPRDLQKCEEIDRPCLPCGIHFLTTELGDISVKRLPQSAGSLSDLLPGKYEGGGAVWECSMDLARILATEGILTPASSLDEPQSFLELGCGTAIPGIVTLLSMKHIKHAMFIDFNRDVVENITWPNILMNCPPEKLETVSCMAGDWNACEYPSEGFDVILTAETLYTAETTRQIFRLIQRLLKPSGVALIASKKYYFGVGGGTYDLEVLCRGASSGLDYELVARFEDTHSNVREVIRLTKKAVSDS
jgi:SAM-dependent methyltransferase